MSMRAYYSCTILLCLLVGKVYADDTCRNYVAYDNKKICLVLEGHDVVNAKDSEEIPEEAGQQPMPQSDQLEESMSDNEAVIENVDNSKNVVMQSND